ncbi:conjugal transfer protein [Streptomyces sp. H10-C2]|uniref:conjugal transfer protein n=1 Tax=unclassified Streptomyces TaxID=2593676 RepID=UPI0024B960F9|nr:MULTISPECIES: conjugal transfer protein [unclassified Streptomyces]MDJ0346963.1 conjugal transfer protein [Streptomyces sp. PH10-H1]MDJ0374628.1 conjugal transfer protein [Streptomyces sp. H10-C2]
MSWWRKVLSLPEKKNAGGDEFADAVSARAGQRRADDGTTTPAAAAGAAPGGWAEEEDSSRAGRWSLRIVVYCVLGLMAFLGVRSIAFPPRTAVPLQQANPQAEARKDDVPEAAAQQVAARFARSYLTWSQDNPKAREADLAADLPKDADAKSGWDGNGQSTVAQTIPGQVTQTGPHQARVSVAVRVAATTGQGPKARTISSWRGLEVPVADSGGRVLVTGQPALVGVQQPAEWKAPDAPDTDANLSQATRAGIDTFFKAWVAGTADQAAAPGAKIAPLGDGMELRSVDTWSVEAGAGARRTGLATVRWKVAGAELQQTYRVTIAQVSASGATRWQAWQVTSQ